MTEPNENQSSLCFDLRDKIAAVLRSHWPGECTDTDEDESPIDHLADAVIRELGLEPQVHYDPDCEFYRYVTDWIDPQTSQKVDLP